MTAADIQQTLDDLRARQSDIDANATEILNGADDTLRIAESSKNQLSAQRAH